MAETQGDVLMILVQGSRAIAAGGTSDLDGTDSMLSGFSAGKFFEIEHFALGLNLSDFDAGHAPGSVAGQPKPPAVGGAHKDQTAAVAPQKSKFASWRDRKKSRQAITAVTFPVELDPFSFTKMVDRASPLLFESCASTASFDSATIVKRKVTGKSTNALQGYMRIDFSNVLLVGLTWDDGEMIKEKCRFICRGMRVQYRPQVPDGTLAAASSAEWSFAMSLRKQQG